VKYFITYFFIVISGVTFAEMDSLLINAESRLKEKLEALRSPTNTDEQKNQFNLAFKAELEKTFQLKGVFDYPFSKLSSLGSIKSSDEVVRIFNWNLEHEDFSQSYYCYIMQRNPRNNSIEVTELIDNSAQLEERPEQILTAENWYGALYYTIIPKEKSGKTYYTLLGWDGNSLSSTIKLIDVLYFSGKKPKLGYNLFKTEEGIKKRIFFEYKEQAVMSLKYDKARNMIIFDHLSPETPALKGFYAYYVPDLSYDAFEFDKNYWEYRSDIISINKADDMKMTIYTLNKKTGQTEAKQIKREWINPSDGMTGDGKHVAVMPGEEDIKKPENKVKKTKKPKTPGKYKPGSIFRKGK
jgi:hypothetical protein